MGKTIQFTDEQKDFILQEYKNKKSMTNIGKALGVSNRPIKRVLQENNIHIRTISENRREDLTGQIFGKLTVLQIDPDYVPATGKHTKWLCQCECGNIVSIASNHLKEGSQSACSPLCKHKISAGTQFGALVVIEPTALRSKNGGAVMYKCMCNCGEECYASSTDLRAGRKVSCDKCKDSRGETKIRALLDDNKISYEKEKKFNDCVNLETKSHYRFDFFVDNKYIIEFDGRQHFAPVDFFGGQEYLEICQARDKIKNQYCKEHNIPLIRIPYTRLEKLNIDDIRLETSKFRII